MFIDNPHVAECLLFENQKVLKLQTHIQPAVVPRVSATSREEQNVGKD